MLNPYQLLVTSLILYCLLFLSLNGICQPAGSSLTAQVDAIFEPWTHPGSPGGVVGIVQNGELVLSRAYGLASLEYDVPIDSSTIFNVASVSKQFTAFAVVLLDRRGELSLDDDVRRHLPELPDFGAPITLRYLLNHSSGLRNFQNLLTMAGWRDGDVMTNADLLKYIQWQEELNFPVNSEFLYCNTGYNLMVEVVERVSGQSFIDWTKENIFLPLGMLHSGFREDLEAVYPNSATSYEGTLETGFTRPKPFWGYIGNGNLCTTVGDLSKWIANFDDHTLGGPEAYRLLTERGVLTTGDTIRYALGVFVDQYRGVRHIQHGGSIGGFRASLNYFPHQNTGIIVLSNFSSAGTGGKAMAVADLYLEEHFTQAKRSAAPLSDPVDRKAVDIDPRAFDPVAGHYWVTVDGGSMTRFYREGGRFLVEVMDGPTFELTAASDTSFFVKEAPISILTHRNNAGTVDQLTIYTPEQNSGRRIDSGLLAKENLRNYVGDYYSPELKTTYSLFMKDGQLMVSHRRHNDFPLIPREKDRFAGGAWFFSDVRAERDGAGSIEALRVSNGRVRNLRLEKQ